MASSDDPATHYDRVTRAWTLLLGEDLHYGLFARGDEPLAVATTALTARMAERGRIAPGVEVLDVGCGTGQPACELAERWGARVTGITISAEGVRMADARAVERGLTDRVRFRLADAQGNGEPDATYDRAWVMESSHLMPDKRAMLREAGRVLRPGGRLVLCDVIRRADLPLSEVLKHAKAFDTLRRAFGRAKMEPLSFYRDAAVEVGLAPVLEEDISAETRPTFARWRENAGRHRDEVVPLIGEAELGWFEASCDILERFWDAGVLGYGLFAADKPG